MTHLDKLIDKIRVEAYRVLFGGDEYDEDRFLWAIYRDLNEACQRVDCTESDCDSDESYPSAVLYRAYRVGLVSAIETAMYCDVQAIVPTLVEEAYRLSIVKPLRKLHVKETAQQV
jgi:hypothetical protein